MKIAMIIAAIVSGVATLVETISGAVAKHRRAGGEKFKPEPNATVERLRAKAEAYRKKAR